MKILKNLITRTIHEHYRPILESKLEPAEFEIDYKTYNDYIMVMITKDETEDNNLIKITLTEI